MLYCHRVPGHLAYAATIIIAWLAVWNPLLSVIILNSCAVSASVNVRCGIGRCSVCWCPPCCTVHVGCNAVILCSTLYIRNQARRCCNCRKNKLVDCCGPLRDILFSIISGCILSNVNGIFFPHLGQIKYRIHSVNISGKWKYRACVA